MVREPPRKCSFCGQHGHNSRTCNNNNSKASATTFNNNNNKPHSVKLFGVNINDEIASPSEDPIKKSKSMGNLIVSADGNDDADAAANSTDTESGDGGGGYLSDGLIHNKRRKAAHERKKGTPWSEEEHRVFLMGLNDLGKGDWRGISMKYVHTRTPTQVASHAQKYFLRQSSNDRKKRRSSLFDMPYTPEYDSASSSSRVKPVPENPQLASRPHFLPGNSSAELMQRFPHLCLDKYPVPIRPAPANYHPVPYPYTMGIPANVQACWPMRVFNFGTQSYLYNNNNNNNNGFGAVMVHHHHPSGIPPATTPTSDPAAARKLDGLELEIGLPQPSPATSAPSSPASGAIKVT